MEKVNNSEKEPTDSEVAETEQGETDTEEAEEIQKWNEEEIARMQQELEEAKSQSEAATDMMLRLAAELDNYKKRTIKERESLLKYATQNIIKELLPIVDNLERAIESTNESRDFNLFLEGVKLILNQVSSLLEKEGVSKIDAVGKVFDPNVHEAVMHVASEEHPENVIIQELQKGYILYDKVLRPSMVVVSKGAEK